MTSPWESSVGTIWELSILSVTPGLTRVLTFSLVCRDITQGRKP